MLHGIAEQLPTSELERAGVERIVYQRLAEVARTRGLVPYGEVAPLVGLGTKLTNDRRKLGIILGEISQFEHAQGRPLLSSLVVYKGTDYCGPGFIKLAESLGLDVGLDRRAFCRAEQAKVHAEWARQA